jgi:hypothetical protein
MQQERRTLLRSPLSLLKKRNLDNFQKTLQTPKIRSLQGNSSRRNPHQKIPYQKIQTLQKILLNPNPLNRRADLLKKKRRKV